MKKQSLIKALWVFLFVFALGNMFAQSVSIWDGSSEIWTQGSGTESNPYLIENAQQLAYIAEMVNGGVTHYNNTYFKLTSNVYIDSTTSWEPIGLNETYYFGGHFNGNNHVVTLYLTTSTLQYVSIFGYANNGSFSNLNSAGNVTCTTASSTTYAGGICGYSTVAITNCHNTGDIFSSNGNTNYSYSGGICGYSTAIVTNCHNTGNITAPTFSSSRSYSGGICGFASGTVLRCYNTGDISSSSTSTTSSTAQSRSGGICGYSSAIIKNCYNTGDISASNSSTSQSGGICGNGKSTTSIINCYNTGDISSNQYSGGICGYSTVNSNVVIENCYNVGSLLSGTHKGGICGNSCSITNCHYLNTCGHTASSGGTAKTEAQMKSSSFPVILNVDSIVFVMDITPNINQGYPVFGNVSTQNASDVGATTATLNGRYQMLYDVDAHGFEYKATNESNYTTVNTTGDSPVSYNLSGIQGGTEYTYRFFVQKDGVVYRGKNKTFITAICSLVVQVTATPANLCDGDTVTYTAVPSGSSGYQYSWSNGSHSNAINITTDSTYTVTVTDNIGCQATASKQLTMYPAAVASITGNAVLCNNGSTTLTANGGNTYYWNTGSAQRIITVNQPGTYIATVQTVYGCTASDTVEVVAFANPVINGNTVFCLGDYTTLTATGGDTYLWSTGATTASINVNTAGNYSVTASTSNGCSGSASVTVIQNQADNVTISGNTVICSGIGTTLTASSGADYLWSTGETTQYITANNPGVYSVTVTNSNGCSSSTTQTVSLMEQTTISGNSHICSGQSTTLSANGSGSYAWNNGANTSFITVNIPGNYSVTVTMPNGCASSASVDVTIGTTPTPTILGNTTFCQGQTSTLTANGGTTYVWNNASTNNSITVSQSGVYTVTATNAEGCSNTANVTVTVNPLPNVSISGNSSFCQGNDVTLTVTGANTYVWNNASTNASITVSSAGNYTVTGTDANGCSNTAIKTVTVNPTYNVALTHSMCEGENYNFYGQNITVAGTYTHTLQTVNGCDSVLTLTVTLKALPPTAITGNTTLCEGETTTLTANGGTSYLWSNAATTNSINVSQSGVYTVTATNVEGCSNTANITVTVNPLPTITIGGNTTICAGSSTTLTASGANTYIWSTGDNTASVTINEFGIYTVTGTSSEGCSNTATVTVLVSQLPVITISGETDICAGESTTLTANGGETYLWNDGTTDNTLTVSTAGTYQVIGYNAAGCNAMASATVNIWQPATSEFTIETSDSCYTWNSIPYCTSGTYTQTLQTIHGCDSVVTLYLTVSVGIDDLEGFDFMVYPNPTTGIVNVQCSMNNVQEGTMEFHVFDAFGRLLRTTDGVETLRATSLQTDTNGNSTQTAQIDLSHYAAGVYFIKTVADGNVVAARKVVKR